MWNAESKGTCILNFDRFYYITFYKDYKQFTRPSIIFKNHLQYSSYKLHLKIFTNFIGKKSSHFNFFYCEKLTIFSYFKSFFSEMPFIFLLCFYWVVSSLCKKWKLFFMWCKYFFKNFCLSYYYMVLS